MRSQTLQVAARERETLGWVKAEVAATTERLQSAEDFPEFAAILLSRISESFDLLYGAFYLADESHTRFTRVGAFATDVSTRTARIHARRRLWWGKPQLSGVAFRLSTLLTKPLHVSAGVGTVTPACVLFHSRDQSGRRAGGYRTGAFGSGVGASAGTPRCAVTDRGPQHEDPDEQAGNREAARANSGSKPRIWRLPKKRPKPPPKPSPISWPT